MKPGPWVIVAVVLLGLSVIMSVMENLNDCLGPHRQRDDCCNQARATRSDFGRIWRPRRSVLMRRLVAKVLRAAKRLL